MRQIIKQRYLTVWTVEKIKKVKTQKLEKQKNGRIMFFIKPCGSKKSRFIKEQGASGLLNNFGIKTNLDKIPIIGPILTVSF